MKVVVVGNGLRARNLYIPVIQKLKKIKLHGICGKNFAKAKEFAKKYKIIAYRNITQIINDKEVDAIIVCVDWISNSIVYKKLSATNIPLLLETPLGHNFTSVQEVFESLSGRSSYVGIAEQYHLRPTEIVKRQLIQLGVFGDVFYAYNINVGHEYHGISIIRSYLGMKERVKKVLAYQQDFPYYKNLAHKSVFFNGERLQNALIEFESGKAALYSWSWLAYNSPIRNLRYSGFYGTKGISIGNEMSYFRSKKSLAYEIKLERRTRVIEGIEVLYELIASANDSILCRWKNPFAEIILHDEEIPIAMFINNLFESTINSNTQPLYSLEDAFNDHQIVYEINKLV